MGILDETVVSGTEYGDETLVSGTEYGDETLVSGSNNASDIISKGFIFKTQAGKKYQVLKRLSKRGGQSEIFMGLDASNNKLVIKRYINPLSTRHAQIHETIVKFFKSQEGKNCVLPYIDGGIIELDGKKYLFDIYPYIESGDMGEYKNYSFDEIKEIIRAVNESLHSIHKAGIYHRDLKPNNLYKMKDANGQDRIVIGDFGIARLANSNNRNDMNLNLQGTVHMDFSPGFSAPETFHVINGHSFFSEASDYYSFGVTIACLYDGRYVYDGLSPEQLSMFNSMNEIPMRRMDEDYDKIRNLVQNLCCFDYTKRFTYGDVEEWLDNPYYVKNSNAWGRNVYQGLRGDYKSEAEFFNAATANKGNWEEAKKQMFGDLFINFFKSFSPRYTRVLENKLDECDKGRISRDKGLADFLTFLYPTGPICWKGVTFNSFKELAEGMLQEGKSEFWSGLLKERVISSWRDNSKGISIDNESRSLIDKIENFASEYDGEIGRYWFAYAFSGVPGIEFMGNYISSIDELIDYILESPKLCYEEDRLLILSEPQKYPELYGFILSKGFLQAVKSFMDSISKNKDNEFARYMYIFYFLEVLAQNGNESKKKLVLNYFSDYGPLGIYKYIHNLVREENVYSPLDEKSKEVLTEIGAFKCVKNNSIDRLYKSYSPLIEKIHMLKGLVINPLVAEMGLYNNEGIICNNMKGLFAFKVYGKDAAIGFSDYFR
ncbi:MAG: protein kinase [Eubacterium sp.]|nr:protein kinase [Eubacterium sp.]